MIFLIAIFLSLIAVFVLLKKATEKDESPAAQNEVPTDDSGCCGAHEVCEKDSLLNTQNKFEYYDDEELDQFAGMKSEEYSETDIEEFCKVFYTMRESDVVGWLKSLQLRNIELPEQLRDEALLIVQEIREKRSK
ncbi:MAG: phospholipase [Paludibacteraceae bacterium]|jgi:hypothetical protein|nr:phospholipase [Paludibacteraceae bacterium]MEE1542569.1 phospholipase [Paludibacteraceae bacterium]